MDTAETTVITAIEAGSLETQVLLLAASLRAFGGKYSRLPMWAIKPRRGPGLARATLNELERLEVRFVDKPLNRDHAWWEHANKAASMRFAEMEAKTPNVTWMDGDMMILREPDAFAPPGDAQFIARAGEGTDVASDGRDDGSEFWRRLCRTVGLDYDAFPEIVSFPDRRVIRAYWQSGIFTYRREVAFGAAHGEMIGRMLKGSIASAKAGTFHTDQVSAALAVQALKLRAAQYEPRMNFNFNFLDKASADLLPISEVRVLHYHGSLGPGAWGWARQKLAALPADRLQMLDAHAPLSSPHLRIRLVRRLLGLGRDWRKRSYEARVKRY